MALDRDELNKRRREREAYRRKRQQAMYTRLAIAIAVLLACAVGIFILIQNSQPVSAPVIATEAAPVIEETEAPTEKRSSWDKEPVKIHIAAAGDLNVTDSKRIGHFLGLCHQPGNSTADEAAQNQAKSNNSNDQFLLHNDFLLTMYSNGINRSCSRLYPCHPQIPGPAWHVR